MFNQCNSDISDMFGGVNNGNPAFPAFMEENRFQYDMSSLPQLQLFGECEFSQLFISFFFSSS